MGAADPSSVPLSAPALGRELLGGQRAPAPSDQPATSGRAAVNLGAGAALLPGIQLWLQPSQQRPALPLQSLRGLWKQRSGVTPQGSSREPTEGDHRLLQRDGNVPMAQRSVCVAQIGGKEVNTAAW